LAALSSKLAVGARGLTDVTEVGSGASAGVFRATDGEGGEVALKVAIDPRDAARLADEGERLLLARSESLTRVLGAGVLEASPAAPLSAWGGHPFLLLELAPGAPLEPRARRSARQREQIALVVARDVGAALADLHASGTAHGDIKPMNVVMDERSQRARLVDLGLSAPADDAIPKGGTVRYLAPEVRSAEREGDGRARDLWALGITLAELASAEVAQAADPARAAERIELPGELGPIVRALLAPAAGARPSAAWVGQRARSLLGEAENEVDRRRRDERAVERSYLAARRHEIFAAAAKGNARIRVAGAPGRWLADAVEIAEALARLRVAPSGKEALELGELGALGWSRWLTSLIGPAAAHWPPPRFDDDAALAERLLELVRGSSPAVISRAALEGQGEAFEPAADPVALAHALGAAEVPGPVLDQGERWVLSGEAPTLALPLARALRLRGELGRALALLDRAGGAEARVEAAETARRAGDPSGARARLSRIELDSAPAAARARALATLARMELDAGNVAAARTSLDDAPPTAAVLEVRALVDLASGDRAEAERAIEEGLARAHSDEERARLLAVRGNAAHAAGDAGKATAAFRRAVEHAVRSGGVLEEATYATGLAAAAANVGEIAEAIEMGGRALVLFEHLGRPGDAARAALSRAASFAEIGAANEARAAARDAMSRARSAGDVRCRAYAHLVTSDALGRGDREAIEHARRGASLVAGDSDDELRAAARLLSHGESVDVAEMDRRARLRDAPIDARIEWWGARALVEAERVKPQRSDAVLTELGALMAARVPLGIRGPALAAGARLAARVGDSEAARRLALGSREAARELALRAPPEHRAAVSTLPWVTSLGAPEGSGVSAEQVGDVEALVRALGRRDRLRPLLDQVLDALILWTGVERGLLLLKAPGGRLVPRSGRNIARDDLVGEQLALSTSLAERALEEREPVIAVDAAGELPDLYASVHALKLRSVLAVPLIARGDVLGVVYLDDRVRRGAFGKKELAWVRLVAALASVAIADARDQLLLRRAARRARRAELRLSDELAKKQAALDLAERELSRAKSERGTRFDYSAIVGRSEPLHALLRMVDRIALSEVPVLIVGESGSGKELVARAIHENGSRAAAPFVSENCAAIPETLLESTLFGHVRGAFTGAARPRAGLFEVADGGTLFLDEIGEMSLGMQSKLLRVLEHGEMHPVGSDRGRRVDVRVIGATHRDLARLVEEGRFRQDLLYRLDVISVRVPPLRERRGDIPILVRHFLGKYVPPDREVRMSKEALDALTAYDWPGNVRQLENEVRRALVVADDSVDLEHLSPEVAARGTTAPSLESELDLRGRVDLLESELVRTALERTGGNQTRAAELLGLSRFGLQKMMKRLSIEVGPKPGRRSAGAVGKRR
jgi:serine/threonine-protein kinase PknK